MPHTAGWLSLLELDLFKFLPLSCAFEMNFYHILVARTALPIVVIAVLAVTGRCLNMSRAVQSDAAVDVLGELGVGSNCYAWCFFLIFLLYPGCAFTAFSTFICSTLDDGSRYVSRDASLDCDDPMHSLMQGYAAVMIVVWPVGRLPSRRPAHVQTPGTRVHTATLRAIRQVGVPLLYSFCFWLEWPTISRLRRREMREESSKALQELRRDSNGNERRLLESELIVTLQARVDHQTISADLTVWCWHTCRHLAGASKPRRRRWRP